MTRLRFAPPPPATDGLLTVAQAAELLQVSPRTIRDWLLKRRITFTKLGRSVRIPRSELNRLVEAGWVSRLGP